MLKFKLSTYKSYTVLRSTQSFCHLDSSTYGSVITKQPPKKLDGNKDEYSIERSQVFAKVQSSENLSRKWIKDELPLLIKTIWFSVPWLCRNRSVWQRGWWNYSWSSAPVFPQTVCLQLEHSRPRIKTFGQ